MFNLKFYEMKKLAILFVLATFMVAISAPAYSAGQDKPKQEQKAENKDAKKCDKPCDKDKKESCCKGKKESCKKDEAKKEEPTK
jgi:hypothetical protein